MVSITAARFIIYGIFIPLGFFIGLLIVWAQL